MSGDGDYRFEDFIHAYEMLSTSHFGALFGTRVHSRIQFLEALSSAYTENKFLFKLSQLGAFILSFLFSIRSGLLFTDPITGFRSFRRKNINLSHENILNDHLGSPSELALKLIKEGVDIGGTPRKL